MIVLDASAALDLLMRGAAAPTIAARVFRRGESVHAPHLIDLEIAQALRRQAAAGIMTAARADLALDTWRSLPVRRWGHQALIHRVWSLRGTLTAYDAAYVALAETLDAVLVTMDAKIARAPGHGARVEVVG